MTQPADTDAEDAARNEDLIGFLHHLRDNASFKKDFGAQFLLQLERTTNAHHPKHSPEVGEDAVVSFLNRIEDPKIVFTPDEQYAAQLISGRTKPQKLPVPAPRKNFATEFAEAGDTDRRTFLGGALTVAGVAALGGGLGGGGGAVMGELSRTDDGDGQNTDPQANGATPASADAHPHSSSPVPTIIGAGLGGFIGASVAGFTAHKVLNHFADEQDHAQRDEKAKEYTAHIGEMLKAHGYKPEAKEPAKVTRPFPLRS